MIWARKLIHVRSRDGPIRYRLTYTSPDADPSDPAVCGRDLSGDAELDTEANPNIIVVDSFTGVIDDCSTVTLRLTLTKQ